MAGRVIVIGAGPGGLAAAMLLAHAGLDVHVLERQGRVGGRTSTLDLDGFRFDLGPTFFLYPRVLREIFAATGYHLDDEAPMTRLDPQYHLVFGAGGELRCSHDLAAMQEQLALAHLIVRRVPPVTVRADVHVHQPDLTAIDARIAVAQVDAPLPNRLDLGAEQRDPRFPRVEHVVVVTGLAVFRDQLPPSVTRGLLRHFPHRTMRAPVIHWRLT